MRERVPFGPIDLDELDAMLLSRASAVVPMCQIAAGNREAAVIGLRHDVDDNEGSLDTALRLAEWELRRGYRSTYFLLHDSHYWADAPEAALDFEAMGHECGLHVNAIAESLRQKRDPHHILADALSELRSTGVRVVGCVAHGDALCRDKEKRVLFCNDEMFSECARPSLGAADRLIERNGVVLPLTPTSLRAFALDYDSNWLPRGDYLSDSGGEWSEPFEAVVARFGQRQLHLNIHSDWWQHAFVPEVVTA